MENPRPEKVARVAELEKYFSDASSVVLTEYRGLDVPALAELRAQLRGAGAEYKIYKNTLVRIAARNAGLDLEELLTGPTAIAFVVGSEETAADPAAAAKTLRDFAKTNNALVLKGGLMDGASMTADQLEALADLPSREVLLSQFAGALQAPLQKFAALLSTMPTNLAFGLKALIDAKPADAEAAAEPAETDTASTDEADATQTETSASQDEAPAEADAPTETAAAEQTEEPANPAAEATTDEPPADAGSEQES